MNINYKIFDPVAFKLFGINVYWYGISYLVGFLVAFYLAKFLVNKYKVAITEIMLEKFLSWAVFGVVIGGRLGYVLFYELENAIHNPIDIFKIRDGGMSFHGGLLGIIISSVIFSRKHKISLLSLGDILSTVSPFGIFLVRIANFINQEHPGRPTNLPIGIKFPMVDNITRHPSQLYEATFEGMLIFAIMIFSFKKLHTNPGRQSGLFLVLYFFARFVCELFREPTDGVFQIFHLIITKGQLLTIPLLFFGIFLIIKKKNNYLQSN